MRTIWDVVTDLKAHGKKVELLKEERWEILGEASKIIKAMSDEEVEVTLKKSMPESTCYEDAGPHGDYYAVSSGIVGDKSLGYGQTRIEAKRSALKEVVCREGEYLRYEDPEYKNEDDD